MKLVKFKGENDLNFMRGRGYLEKGKIESRVSAKNKTEKIENVCA